jgi:carbon-monoxide dehydrogenase large subunit
MPGSILGNRVLRSEDAELLVGDGEYIADLELDDPLSLTFVRSPVAHGTISGIDLGGAPDLPGVVAVWTAAELDLPPAQGFMAIHDDFRQPPLAAERVRFAGDRIVAVVAETPAIALDATELITVDVDSIDAVIDPEQAFSDAPLIFPEHGSNVALEMVAADSVDPGRDADLVVRGRYENQRMAVVCIEPNGVAAVPGPDGRLTVHVATQMPHLLHTQLAEAIGVDPDLIRIVCPRVGGGFGGKSGLHPEFTVAAAAALRLGRPVRWIPTRSEDTISMAHSRGQVQYVELGTRRDGTFTGLRVRLVGDSGAYPNAGARLPTLTQRMGQGTYRLPEVQYDVAVAVTNTVPMSAYRGAGRPEAAAMLERLVDQTARELGIDPIEIRLRNFLQPSDFPFETLTGVTYDSGDYALPLTVAAEKAGYDDLLLGIGVSAYVEITGGGCKIEEFGALEIHDDGTATMKAGTFSHGQGHQTTYAMLVSDLTGIPVERIRLVDGDTDLVRSGGGTAGSRSVQLAGSAVHRATEAVVEKAKSLAAHLLEADVSDMVVDTDHGTVGVAGVPASALSWGKLARAAAEAPEYVIDSSDGTQGLAAQLDFRQAGPTFPFGAHVCVVEVDRDTGFVRVLRHVAVDDCGTVINPLLVEGQQHGGIAAGIGQALFEQVVHDDEGNLLTSTLVDYMIPTAPDVPSYETHSTETPTPYNPLGAKGIGEAATIGSTPAVQNAVIDAVSHLGVRHIDLPCTPERVWQAIRAAESGSIPDPWSEPPAIFERFAAERAPGDEEPDEADLPAI